MGADYPRNWDLIMPINNLSCEVGASSACAHHYLYLYSCSGKFSKVLACRYSLLASHRPGSIAEHAGPFTEAEVGGDDDAGLGEA